MFFDLIPVLTRKSGFFVKSIIIAFFYVPFVFSAPTVDLSSASSSQEQSVANPISNQPQTDDVSVPGKGQIEISPLLRHGSSKPDESMILDGNPWLIYFGVGYLIDPMSNYDSTINVGDHGTTISSSSSGKNTYGIFGGIEYLTGRRFGLAGEISYAKYKYEGGSSDSLIGLVLVPKLRFSGNGNSGIWIGFGMGYVSTRLGGGLSSSSSEFTITIPSRNLSGFTWTPRLGGDFRVGEGWIGFYLSYSSISESTPFKVTNNSTLAQVGSGDIDIQRDLWAVSVFYAWNIDF